jgi:hypothetical protein
VRCDGTITGAFPSRHHRRGGRTRTSCRVRSPPPPTLAPPLASTLHPSLSRACAQGSKRDWRLLGIDAPGPPHERPGGSSPPGPPRPPGGGWHLGRKQIDPPPPFQRQQDSVVAVMEFFLQGNGTAATAAARTTTTTTTAQSSQRSRLRRVHGSGSGD